MIWAFIFIYFLYAALITCLIIGYKKVTEFKKQTKIAKTGFSVVIPFRNEASNLPALLDSILELNYPKELLEFIFVDDASTDNSILILNNVINTISQKSKISANYIHVINNERKSNSPKKDAITAAIKIAQNNWVVTTDADCILPKAWLQTLDSFIIYNQPKMVVAPVNYRVNNTFLEQFQLLDFMSLQATTISTFGLNRPILCNGANLAYKKDVFLKVNGFSGNNIVASGDDVFLFEKFLEHDKTSVKFLKSRHATVTTFPVKSAKELINQRVRWAAKTSNLNSKNIKIVGAIVLLMNLSIVINALYANNFFYFLLFLALKIGVDIFLFLPTIRFYKHEKSFIKWYLFSSILYPVFSVFIVIKSLFSTYNWKGRNFKK